MNTVNQLARPERLRRYIQTSFLTFAVIGSASLSIPMPALAQEDASPSIASQGEIGTTIVGESEAAIGLYLMPWSDEPMGDVDRPPRLLHEPLDKVDPVEFRRQVEWRRAQTAYRMMRLRQNSY